MSEISFDRYKELLKMINFIKAEKETVTYLEGMIDKTRVCLNGTTCSLQIFHPKKRCTYKEYKND